VSPAYRFAGVEDGKTIRRYWTSTWKSCALKARCTTGPERRISRWEHEAQSTTFMAHKIERASIFLFDGVAFGIAYCGYAWLSSNVAVIFCAGIELAQLTIPDRHARLSDFFVDAIAISVGIFAGSTLIRMRPHREAIIASRSAK
jgi:hypothetical protein